MIVLTYNQRKVLDVIERAEVPQTVREIAEALGLSQSSVRTALVSLRRYGAAEIKGGSMFGGTTWGRSA